MRPSAIPGTRQRPVRRPQRAAIQSLTSPPIRHPTVIAMKGVVPTAELAEVPPAWKVRDIVPLQVPFLGAERCAVVLQRTH